MSSFEQSLDVDACRSRARTSAVLGVIAMTLCMFGMCSSCTTVFPALPVSLIGLFYARAALEGDGDELSTTLARYGLATNGISLAFSLLLIGLVIAYVGMYFLMILAAVGAAVINP